MTRRMHEFFLTAIDPVYTALGSARHFLIACLLITLTAGPGLKAPAQAHPAPPSTPQGVREIRFDLRSGHPFLGLATVIWPGAPFPAQRHDAMLATEMNWTRIPLVNSLNENDMQPGMSVQQLMAQKTNHPLRVAAEHLSAQQLQALQLEDQKINEHYRSLGDELRSVDIRFNMAALPNYPKSWMNTFVDRGTEYHAFMGGGRPGQPDHRQDYATLVVAEVLTARRAGLPVTGIEVPFEPDDPGATMRPDVANAIVGKLRNTLDENGLANIEIASPGTGLTVNAGPWVAALEGKGGHSSDVKYYSAHEYETAKFPAPAGLSAKFLQATHGAKPILVTEFNSDAPRWSKPPYIGTPRSSPPQEGLNPANAANHTEFATSVVAEGLKLISDGASGICVWEMNDIYWKKTSYGMIDLKGNPRPTIAAFATLMKQVGRSSNVKAFGTNAGTGLGAAAFTVTRDNQNGLVAALANVTGAPIRVKLAFGGQDASASPGSRPLIVAATFPAGGATHLGDSASPTLVIPPETIIVLSNLPPR